MIDIFTRIWNNLVERTEGPMSLRFILQPLMSVLFATLAAIKDAKAGTLPLITRWINNKADRKKIFREAWKDVGKIWIIGFLLDTIYQLIVIFKFKTETHFYPLESILVAFGLAIVPYAILRGPLNRVMSLFIKKKNPGKTGTV